MFAVALLVERRIRMEGVKGCVLPGMRDVALAVGAGECQIGAVAAVVAFAGTAEMLARDVAVLMPVLPEARRGENLLLEEQRGMPCRGLAWHCRACRSHWSPCS